RAEAAPAGNLRLFIIAASEGYRTGNWQPADGPLTAPLPSSSSPLEAHKGSLIFLHDMANKGFTGCAACGHGAYGTVYYAQAPKGGTGEYAEPSGATFDQIIAKGLGANSNGRASFHT